MKATRAVVAHWVDPNHAAATPARLRIEGLQRHENCVRTRGIHAPVIYPLSV